MQGITEGFRVGFRYRDSICRSAKSNMLSAQQNPEVIDRYLAKEMQLERVVRSESRAGVHINRFGVIPKPHQPGKWRLILDLSYPQGASVNDGIEKELCSLKYSSVEMAVRRIIQLGPGALMAKLDIESAYRIVSVHPDDRHLSGMRWRGKTYVDRPLA